MLFQADIKVAASPIHGQGVFARQDFKPGDLIEECPILITPSFDRFRDFLYVGENGYILPLGYGCLYNHAVTPNADYIHDPLRELLIITAEKAIKAGEEIVVNYGSKWFALREMKIKYPIRYRLRKIFTRRIWRFSLVIGFIVCLLCFLGKTA